MRLKLALLSTFVILSACQQSEPPEPKVAVSEAPVIAEIDPVPETEAKASSRFDIYSSVQLTADIDHLTENQRNMIPLLIDAAKIMDNLFWRQSYGNPDELLAGIEDEKMRRFAEMNYGPWDRLDANKSFVESYGPKPAGARFYPEDMTREEFDAWDQEDKDGEYSLVKRGPGGGLELVPYHVAFAEPLAHAAGLLREAADLAEDPEFAHYLRLRADALVTVDF